MKAFESVLFSCVFLERKIPEKHKEYVCMYVEELLPEIREQLAQSLSGESYKIYRKMHDDAFHFDFLSVHEAWILVLWEKYSTGIEKDRQKMAQLPEYQKFKASFDEEEFLRPYVEKCLNINL